MGKLVIEVIKSLTLAFSQRKEKSMGCLGGRIAAVSRRGCGRSPTPRQMLGHSTAVPLALADGEEQVFSPIVRKPSLPACTCFLPDSSGHLLPATAPAAMVGIPYQPRPAPRAMSCHPEAGKKSCIFPTTPEAGIGEEN